MSLKIGEKRVIKVNQKEFEHILLCREIDFLPTKKGIELLYWIFKKLPFGTAMITTHLGEPAGYEDPKPTGTFTGKLTIEQTEEQLEKPGG